jgi:cytoskeleton protein RodZ
MQVELNSFEDIGDYLREVRESLALDTRDIGQRLNIRAKYLEALERGAIAEIPGKVYARGYLQNYAEFLGIDKDEIADAFDRLNGGGTKVHYFVPEPTERHYQPGMLVVAVALIVVTAIYYYWYKNHNVSEPPEYQRVSPVPERLIDPIIEAPEMQENDDTFEAPYFPQAETLQGDKNRDAAPQTPAEPEQQPEASAEASAESQAAPANNAAPLPWLNEE